MLRLSRRLVHISDEGFLALVRNVARMCFRMSVFFYDPCLAVVDCLPKRYVQNTLVSQLYTEMDNLKIRIYVRSLHQLYLTNICKCVSVITAITQKNKTYFKSIHIIDHYSKRYNIAMA